jgi:hypothetical protein
LIAANLLLLNFLKGGGFLKKDNVHGLRLGDVKLGKDIKIVSTCFINPDTNELFYHRDGIETSFEPSVIQYIYYIDNHEIDVELAIQLGLGVFEHLSTGKRYLYNADDEADEDTEEYELLRMGMYYQIVFPDYVDRKLDFLFINEPTGEYLKILAYSSEPIKKLKEIFKSQKGKRNNVIQFKI